jgi:hypothetical protein
LHRALRIRAAKIVTAALAAVAAVTAAFALPGPAGAAGNPIHGNIHRTFQHRNGSIFVAGWVYNRQHQHRHPGVCLIVNGNCVRVLHPSGRSPQFDRLHHIRGRHRFAVTLRPHRPGIMIGLRATGPNPVHLDRMRALSPGRRVVRVARRHLGSRYVYGGTSPRGGFDCSGYTMFSYRRGQVARLPHNADAQRRSRGMHRIRRRAARPGDLVFYLRGGSAYHVAIYAGHGYQYSATDPQEGVRYQPISSRNVVFGTDWHH